MPNWKALNHNQRVRVVLEALKHHVKADSKVLVEYLKTKGVFGLTPQQLSMWMRFNMEHRYVKKKRVDRSNVIWEVL